MKKIFSTMAVAAALFAGYNAYCGQNSNELSDVALANVEALAVEEATSKEYKCYSILEGEGTSIVCSNCQLAPGTPPWYHSGSKCTI